MTNSSSSPGEIIEMQPQTPVAEPGNQSRRGSRDLLTTKQHEPSHGESHHASIPKPQPPLAEMIPNAWTNKPLFWRQLLQLRLLDFAHFFAFLCLGPVCALAGQLVLYVVILCVEALTELGELYNPLYVLAFAPVVFPLIVYLSERYFPGIEASGIPKLAVAYRLVGTEPKRPPKNLWDDIWNGGVFEHMISLRIAVGKALMHLAATIGGVSLGPEGPVLQIGASIGSVFCKVIDLPFFYHRGAILAGAATCMGSIFNAPIGALVFCIEEVAGEFEFFGQRMTMVFTVGLGSLVTYYIPHSREYFYGERVIPAEMADWGAVPVLGILLGLLGGIFGRILIEGAKFRKRHPEFVKKWRLPFAFIVAVITVLLSAWIDGAVYGPGENIARILLNEATFNNAFPEDLLFHTFGAFKFLATLLCGLTNIAGGAFVPGHAIGVGFGVYFSYILPWVHKETVLMLSLVAYFSGFTQGAFNTVVLAAETSRMDSSRVPLAYVTAVIAAAASKLICPYPFYHYLARVGNQPIPVKNKNKNAESTPEQSTSLPHLFDDRGVAPNATIDPEEDFILTV